MKKEEFNKIWRKLQRERKKIYDEWRTKKKHLNIWFNEKIKNDKQSTDKSKRSDSEDAMFLAKELNEFPTALRKVKTVDANQK